MAEWRRTTLDQLVKLQRGHDLPTSLRKPGTVPVVGAAGPSGTHDTAIVKAPGVVLGRAGASMGTATYCDVDFWPLNTSLYVTDFLGNDPRFVYYLLDLLDFSGYNSGAAQPMLNRNYITQIEIRLPHPKEQKDIASVLGALEDKVSFNKRLAITLESLLRSMYDSARDKAGVVRLDQISSLVRDSVKPEDLTGEEPYIGLEHMPRKSIWLEEWGKALEVSSNKNRFTRGDILFGKLRPYFHKVGLAQASGVCSTDIIVVRATEHAYRCWLLMALSSDEVVAHATARSGGTRMPRAKWSDLAAFEVPWPNPEERARFEAAASPLIERAVRGSEESRTLAALRDTLLPQLMSGKLRVREAEEIVEDAV
ncbi:MULTISPECIES: restriction endonuclease subunit S [unclassified Streptomyces]|uniref:restriction endonuclease subunit S n=1 Tax=unclassified Streptomyces TaxID=2593676 RepID=UPI00247580A3|nr:MULTISPECIES: restriction endonuclease subunit S [unclassified Streptomyces]MDH6451725.1 type I restriction enzyme S subunit [Streptomyces sp. SAI-119]MDH6497718.1 type I restriction enzyme S subunit [Streptomyces sp. SAI-149]